MSNEVSGPAPPKHQVRCQIVRVDWIEPRTFTCVSPVPWAKWVHFVGKRSEECMYPDNCPTCNIPVEQKWLFWIQVLDVMGKEQCFLELTRTAYEIFKHQLHHGKDWRGMRFQINKSKGGKKGRFKINVLEHRIDPRDLPPSFDPVGILRFLWNVGRNRPVQFREEVI